jgi:hypothetical protein
MTTENTKAIAEAQIRALIDEWARPSAPRTSTE